MTVRSEDVARLQALQRRLKHYRERHALTQEAFAEQCGLSRSQIANIERGAYYPGKPSRSKIAAAIGVSVEDLY